MALSIKENIVVGFSDFWSRKLRSFITIFGIILGTMSIIVVLSLVNGMNKQTLKWMIERGGFTKLTIRSNWRYDNKKHLREYLTLKEIEEIVKKVKEIKYFSPEKRTLTRFQYKDSSDLFSLAGVMPQYLQIYDWEVAQGRFLNDYDVKNKSKVIVIGTKAKENLFGNENPIGKYITVRKKKFKVIGIMKRKFYQNPNSGNGGNMLEYMNEWTFIPLTTFLNRIENSDKFTKVELKAANIKDAETAAKKLERLLKEIRRNEPVFWVWSMEENKKRFEKNSAVFRIIFYIISAISMLIGGIVIMNILLSTIRERTREIGVRIAVGAKRLDIFMQFLIQTVLITFIGGVIGVSLALLFLKQIAKIMGFTLIPNIQTVVVALIVSVGVGLIFGVLPSIKASKLNPVDALRYE